MVDARKTLHREIIARLSSERGDVAAAAIPALSLVEQMAVRRQPLPAFAPRSVAAQRYEQLWAETLATV
jgi:chromosome partitioning protein